MACLQNAINRIRVFVTCKHKNRNISFLPRPDIKYDIVNLEYVQYLGNIFLLKSTGQDCTQTHTYTHTPIPDNQSLIILFLFR